MSNMVGKYIRDEWNNGNFKRVWLRRIVAETKTQYVCHVQRDVIDYDVKPIQYAYYSKWAKRYRKDKSELGFKTIFTKRSNPDGKSTLSLVDNLKTLICECTFEELFDRDVRGFQDAESYPRKILERRNERYKERGETYRDSYKIKEYCVLQSSKGTDVIDDWDAPITKYLEEQFECPVYSCYETISEYHNLSKLTKSATFLHINHFGDDKPKINEKENFFNRTIMFWYFGDKLIFYYADGMGTH